MSHSRSDSAIFLVNIRSSADGDGSPDGWLWYSTTAVAFSSSAWRMTSRVDTAA